MRLHILCMTAYALRIGWFRFVLNQDLEAGCLVGETTRESTDAIHGSSFFAQRFVRRFADGTTSALKITAMAECHDSPSSEWVENLAL